MRHSLLVLPALCAAMPAPAQERTAVAVTEWNVERWNTESGLPQNTVRGITQTPDGYLWLATLGGLVRFDGVRFTVFTSSAYPALTTDRMNAVTLGANGALWIGTEQGVVRFQHGAFAHWGTDDGVPSDLVGPVLEDSRGRIWIPTRDGIGRLEGARVRVVATDKGPGRQTYRIFEDADSTVWFDFGNELGRYDEAVGRVQTVFAEASPRVAAAIGLDRERRLWVRLDRELLQVARTGVRRYPLPLWARDAFIGDLGSGPDSTIWFRVAGNGIAALDTTAGRAARFSRVAIPPALATGDHISMFLDAEGVPWIGSNSNGLARLRPRLFRVLGADDGLAENHATAALVARDGAILSGSGCLGLSRIATGRRRPIGPLSREGFCVWSLLEEPDGTLWVGGVGAPLLRHRGGNVSGFGPAQGLTDQYVLAIHRARDGVLWAGTEAGGVFAMRDGRFEAAYTTKNGLPSNRTHTIVEDPDGTLWFGTTGGLARRDMAGALTSWTVADGLPHAHVRAIHRDRNGRLWIGTYGGGMALFDGTRFSRISAHNGLGENVVSAILEDDDGWFWMSGNRGIQRVRHDELAAFAAGEVPSVHATLYGESDGLVPNETNGGFQPAAWRGADGRLWFPTIRGLAVVQPRLARSNPVPPRLAIENILLDGRRDSSRGPSAGTVTVPPGTRSLEVNYTGLSTTAPERIEFRYRLADADNEDWTYAGTRRTAYFSALPPGQYRFEVSAANRDGVWSTAPAGLTLDVRPTLLQSTWFRALIIVLVAGAGAELVRRRLARERGERERQRAFARALLTQQEAERKRIAGELHDAVGQDLLVIKNRALMALRGNHGTPVAAETAPHLTEITGMADEAIAGVRRIAYNLRPFHLDRFGLTAALRAAVTRAVELTEIRFALEIADVDRMLPPDSEIHVFRIVQEGVSNVIRHSGAASASVCVSRDAGAMRVRIEDDGRGFKGRSAGRRPGDGGFGLTGIRERVQVLGGTLAIESPDDGGAILEMTIPLAPTAPATTPAPVTGTP